MIINWSSGVGYGLPGFIGPLGYIKNYSGGQITIPDVVILNISEVRCVWPKITLEVSWPTENYDLSIT
jgi:hypothetical protein